MNLGPLGSQAYKSYVLTCWVILPCLSPVPLLCSCWHNRVLKAVSSLIHSPVVFITLILTFSGLSLKRPHYIMALWNLRYGYYVLFSQPPILFFPSAFLYWLLFDLIFLTEFQPFQVCTHCAIFHLLPSEYSLLLSSYPVWPVLCRKPLLTNPALLLLDGDSPEFKDSSWSDAVCKWQSFYLLWPF